MKQTRLSLCIALALAVSSCASLKPEPPAPQAEPPAPVKQAPPPTAPISAESLYNLLVAELAGKSDRPDIALGNYLQEAHKTRDPGVAERATQIARYLGAHQASLDGAMLWAEISPDNLQARQILAMELIHADRAGEAQTHLNVIAEKGQPNSFESLVINNRFISSGERKKLLDAIKKINERYPNNADAWFARALLHEQEKDLDATLAALDKAVNADPHHISAAVAEGKMLIALKKPDKAETILEKAVASNPDNKRLRLAYAQALLAQQKNNAARD
ncbi:MAG TPA: tetratricopeptide repeat protein, partial [Pseudomonadales bacterium]|nr:tetratricopeptide repeat protein [Pseudomonadales bacterium]